MHSLCLLFLFTFQQLTVVLDVENVKNMIIANAGRIIWVQVCDALRRPVHVLLITKRMNQLINQVSIIFYHYQLLAIFAALEIT